MVIIPNAFRIELIKIAIRKIGAIHLIMTVNIFFAFECAVIRSFYFINDGLRLDHEPTKTQVSTATIGISTLLLMKSIASRMDIPRGLIKSSAPNPREVGIPISSE